MKKVIIGLSALMVLSFVVIFAVNAQSTEKKDKKAATEVTKDCSKCPSAAGCKAVAGSDPVPGGSAGCAAMACDPAKCKEGKCDPATCKANCKVASSGMKCDPAKCSQNAGVKK